MEAVLALLTSMLLFIDYEYEEPPRLTTCIVHGGDNQLFVRAESFEQVESDSELHEGEQLYVYCIGSAYEGDNRVFAKRVTYRRRVVVQCDDTWDDQISEINKCNTEACRLPPILLRKNHFIKKEFKYLTAGQTDTIICTNRDAFNVTCEGKNVISNLDAVNCHIRRPPPVKKRPVFQFSSTRLPLRSVAYKQYPYIEGLSTNDGELSRNISRRQQAAPTTTSANRDRTETARDITGNDSGSERRVAGPLAWSFHHICELTEELKMKGIRLLHGTEVVDTLKHPFGADVACPPGHRLNYQNGFANLVCKTSSDNTEPLVVLRIPESEGPTRYIISNTSSLSTSICTPV